MNGYARLSDLKTALNITGTENDTALVRLSEDVSRALDNETDRIFYSEIATHYFNAQGEDYLNLDRDLLSLTSLDVDVYGTAVYATNLTGAMYWLHPDNRTPYSRVYINPSAAGLPLSWFPDSRRSIRISGMWGYSNDTELTGTTAAEAIDTSETGIDVSSGALISQGETIVIDSEQMYVSSISTNTLTVVRAINGTTAATHLTAVPVYRRRYDGPIERAAILQVTRIYRDQQTGFSGQVANAEFGGFAFNALYPAIRDLVAPYKRQWVLV